MPNILEENFINKFNELINEWNIDYIFPTHDTVALFLVNNQPFINTVKMDRTLISRYNIDYEYDTVYIDYDDTVVEGDKISLPVIKFLYQCKNKGIEVILLTRHEADHSDTVEESLVSHAISKDLFARIIKLSFAEKKSNFVTANSIFIDNSYAERKEVHDVIEIPVFDIEGIEVIEDWRM